MKADRVIFVSFVQDFDSFVQIAHLTLMVRTDQRQFGIDITVAYVSVQFCLKEKESYQVTSLPVGLALGANLVTFVVLLHTPFVSVPRRSSYRRLPDQADISQLQRP